MKMKIILAALTLTLTSIASAAPTQLLCSHPKDNVNYTVTLNVYNDGTNDFATIKASHLSDVLFYIMEDKGNTIVLENRAIYLTVDQKRILHFNEEGSHLEAFQLELNFRNSHSLGIVAGDGSIDEMQNAEM